MGRIVVQGMYLKNLYQTGTKCTTFSFIYRVIKKKYFVKAIKNTSVFMQPYLKTQKVERLLDTREVGRMLGCYANPTKTKKGEFFLLPFGTFKT